MAETFDIRLEVAGQEESGCARASLEVTPDIEEAHGRLAGQRLPASLRVADDTLTVVPRAEGVRATLTLRGMEAGTLRHLAPHGEATVRIDSSGIGELRDGHGTLHIETR